VQAFEPDLDKWDAWRPDEVAKVLARVEAPWYVAAGWAIDLFLGGDYRQHEDIEIAVPRGRVHEVADALTGCELFAAGVPSSGFVTPVEHAGGLEPSRQTWVREPGTGLWRLDVFSEPSEGNTWICRRDERIRLPYDQVIEWTSDGIPYGRPEIVLLFKAKHVREKDQRDFDAVLPSLGPERRRWLVDALELVHPGHHWIYELERG
jgi:Aminoglycoside-2''-adenylyltransferase